MATEVNTSSMDRDSLVYMAKLAEQVSPCAKVTDRNRFGWRVFKNISHRSFPSRKASFVPLSASSAQPYSVRCFLPTALLLDKEFPFHRVPTAPL